MSCLSPALLDLFDCRNQRALLDKQGFWLNQKAVHLDMQRFMALWKLFQERTRDVLFAQGTRTGVPLMYVYYHGIYCVQPWDSWGWKTHKYPRAIGLILRDFPWRGPTLGPGAHILAELPWFAEKTRLLWGRESPDIHVSFLFFLVGIQTYMSTRWAPTRWAPT